MDAGVRDAVDPAAALARLRPVEAHATDGATVESMARGCHLLDVVEDGEPVGAVLIAIDGDTATIRAAASDGACTWSELAVIESALHSMGVRRVGIFTKRPGLVRALGARGYSIVECEMQKDIHGRQ